MKGEDLVLALPVSGPLEDVCLLLFGRGLESILCRSEISYYPTGRLRWTKVKTLPTPPHRD